MTVSLQHAILIDNYDSYTYTIKDYFETLNVNVTVMTNDDPTLNRLEKLKPSFLILSPGPGNPDDAGHTLAVIKKYHTMYPMLGICLGHQCLAQAFGGKVVHARDVVHGKQSIIHHQQEGLFTGVPNPFWATRYHSLVVEPHTLSREFKITAWAFDADKNKVIMAIQHKHYPLFGVQYHPEAILTEHGHQAFQNFINHIA